METETAFFMDCKLSSWGILVYTNVTAMVLNIVFAGSSSMEPSFFRKIYGVLQIAGRFSDIRDWDRVKIARKIHL